MQYHHAEELHNEIHLVYDQNFLYISPWMAHNFKDLSKCLGTMISNTPPSNLKTIKNYVILRSKYPA